MFLRALAYLALIALVGCKHEAARSGDVVIPTPPSSSWLAAQQTAGTLPSPLDGWVLPGGGAPIGSACEASAGQSQAVLAPGWTSCGVSGRVAIEERRTAPMPGEAMPCERRSGPPSATTGRATLSKKFFSRA